jgi:cysteine desulfurase
MEHRLPHNLNLSFNLEGPSVALEVPGIALSRGSACTSDSSSHVLQALGIDRKRALASIRFGLGRFNTDEEVELTINQVVETVRKVRDLGGYADFASWSAYSVLVTKLIGLFKSSIGPKNSSTSAGR